MNSKITNIKLNSNYSIVTIILRITAFLLFLGRAWEHIVWDGPYRNIYYNPHGFGNFLEWITGTPLAEIYRSDFHRNFIDGFTVSIGLIYVLAAISVWFHRPSRKWSGWIIIAGTVALGLTYYGYFVGKHYNWGTLLEHSSQFITPILLLMLLRGKSSKVIFVLAQVSIALTFICHGLFAYGYYPQPGNFIDMMITGWGMSEDVAIKSLEHIGVIDFVFGGIVLIPIGLVIRSEWWSKALKPVLILFLVYGILWGFLTAFARIYLHWDGTMIWRSIEGHLHQFLVRVPHATIPLIILLLTLGRKRT